MAANRMINNRLRVTIAGAHLGEKFFCKDAIAPKRLYV